MRFELPKSVIEAEGSLCGAAFVYPGVCDRVDLGPGQFGHPAWSAIWSALLACRAEGQVPDETVLMDMVPEAAIGYLAKLATVAITEENVDRYAEIVRRGWVNRELLGVAGDIQHQVSQADGVHDDALLDRTQAALSSIESARSGGQAVPIGDIAVERLRQLGEIHEARRRGEVMATGLLTRIGGLDDTLGGLQEGIATVLAARPGMGKSTFAQTIADNLTREGVPVHFFNLEDSREGYADRALSRASGVSSERLRQVEFRQGDMSALGRAVEDLRRRPCWLVEDTVGLNAYDVIRRYRRSRAQHGTRLVIVDLIQKLRGRPKQWNRTEIYEEAINLFADTAKADRVAFLVLAQLNRDCEKREGKRKHPMMSDLKQCGAIEEQSKCIMFLYRHAYYDSEADESEMEIIIAKNTYGKVGIVDVKWSGETSRVF